MKRIVIFAVLFFMVFGYAFSENSSAWNWGGLVRFRPLSTVYSLVLGGFDISGTWVPYVTPGIGIPVEVDFAVFGGITGVSLSAGVEMVPLRHQEKSGFYFITLVGAMLVDKKFTVTGRADAGYQLVTKGGFALTPALGVKYNGFTGASFDFMLDIGFGYRKR